MIEIIIDYAQGMLSYKIIFNNGEEIRVNTPMAKRTDDAERVVCKIVQTIRGEVR
jgi:hypothetical protein